MITDYEWIDDNSQLQELIIKSNNSGVVAFDSEFERVNTFKSIASIFQVKINDKLYIIDVLKLKEFDFEQFFFDKLLMHSGSEDLEIILDLTKTLPNNYHDTQISAALSGFGSHISYQNLINNLCGVELDKAHSRSDWIKRPLTPAQIQYALEDVIYLHESHQILQEKVTSKGLINLYNALIKKTLDAALENNHPEKTFLKMISSKKYTEPTQKLIYKLLKWREDIAVRTNKPRGWILKNGQVIDIAINKPQSLKQFIDKIKLYPQFAKRHYESLMQLYEDSVSVSLDDLPKKITLKPQQGQRLAEMKTQLAETCEKFDIPPGIIANTSQLKELASKDKSLNDLDLWQHIS